MTLTLIIVFALIALLLALALVYSQWPRWLKGLLAIAVSGFYFYGFSAAHSMLGIPSTDALPERFVMLAALIGEPVNSIPANAMFEYFFTALPPSDTSDTFA